MAKSANATKKIIFAIPAAPAAIPPNPKMAAKMATIKNPNDNLNIILFFNGSLILMQRFSQTVKALTIN